MLIGVEGTGGYTGPKKLDRILFLAETKFTEDQMNRSFIRQLVNAVTAEGKHAEYLHGVRFLGANVMHRARQVVTAVETRLSINKKEPVFLAGYSRGGAIVIEAAALLREKGIVVDGLLLFDAVSRVFASLLHSPPPPLPSAPSSIQLAWKVIAPWQPVWRADFIPANVRYVAHAYRDPSLGSRSTFGNCGLKVANPAKTSSVFKKFLATHAALGGLPWEGDHPGTFVPPPPFEEKPISGNPRSLPPLPLPPTPMITKEKDFAAAAAIRSFMWREAQFMGLLGGLNTDKIPNRNRSLA